MLQQTSNTNKDLNVIKFVNSSVGYIVGQSGTILKTTNSGLSVNENDFRYPKSYSYPNPFKTFFTIKIDSNEVLSNANLSIFDLIGNKVEDVNGLYQNEFLIDRKNLKSGMYIYYVKQNDKLISKGKIIAE